jgi:lactoylglutathione lyase
MGMNKKMKKVTGIGGIFFKCADPKEMNEWYEKHLGIPVTDWGAMFQWRELDNPEKEGYTVWSPFPADTTYFDPSKKDFMINYRVEHIEALVEELKNAGVKILDEITDSEYGKFVHILDPEGNSIELFEPPA